MARIEQRHWWFAGRRAICAHYLRRLSRGEPLRILEVGCGTGGNLSMLAHFGEVWAFEPDDKARALATLCGEKHEPRIQVCEGACPNRIPQLGQFDVICMFDVLEHISDDVSTLQSLTSSLRPGGRVLLTVPAYQYLWGPHDRYLHHFRRYSRRSLRGTARSAGLSVCEITSFNSVLFPVAALVRGLEAIMGRESRAGTRIPASPVNRALTLILEAEKHVATLTGIPFGLSILATLEPEAATRERSTGGEPG